jgi:hypothetical protein
MLGALIGVGIVGSASAQSIYGSIRGMVTDPTESAIANAKVSLINQDTGVLRSTLSNSLGEYVFSQLVPGAYTIAVEAQGFKKFEGKNTVLETQGQLTVDLKLEVGSVSETVQVTSEVPLIETSTASQGQLIDNQKLVDLPNIGRNPFMMSKLAPGVQQVGNPAYMRMQDQSGSSQISFVGGPIRGNNYLLDGVPITDMNNRAIVIPSLEAVQEMKVQTNTYDSEIGRTGGGMFNVLMKSGTNEYHGSLGGWLRNTDQEANAFFNNRGGIPKTDQPNRTEYFSVGGPVRVPKVYNGRNRTFFWLAGEFYHDTQGNSGSTAVPTLAERSGDFSKSVDASGALVVQYDPLSPKDANGNRVPFPGNIIPTSRIDKVGSNIAQTFGQPTGTAAFGGTNVNYSGVLPSRAGQETAKIDHRITNWWSANLSYLHYHSLEPGENWFPSQPSSPENWVLDRKADATQINNTLTVNPTTVVAVRYGFNRFPNDSFTRSRGFNLGSLGFSPALVSAFSHPVFPPINFQNYYPGDQMGAAANNSFYVPYSRQFVASVAKYFGRHSLKAGGEWRSISDAGIDFDGGSGFMALSFDDRFTRRNPAVSGGGGSDIASLLLGYPASVSGFQGSHLSENIVYNSAFFQDDIRLNPKLTINLGLRWEHESGLKERNNNLIIGFNPDALNSLSSLVGVPVRGAVEFAGQNGRNQTGNYYYSRFSPRFGLAYQVNSKTTVRGGWGIYWAPTISFSAPYSPEGATATTQPLVTNDGFNTPLISLSNPFPSGLSQPAGTSKGDATGLGIGLTVYDKNAKGTYIQQFSFDVQRELPFNIAVSAAYAGSRSSHLMLGTPDLNINQLNPSYFSLGAAALTKKVTNPYYVAGGPGIIGSQQVSQAQLLRPFPAFGDINIRGSDQNKAQYDSFVMRAQKRLSHGISLLNSLTWSRNVDRSSGGTGSDVNRGSAGPQNVYNLPAEWGLAINDAKIRYSMTGTFELPFGRNKRFLSGAGRATDLVVGGWALNVVNVISTGYPLIITQTPNNNSSFFGGASQRPNTTGASPSPSSQNIDNWINPAAFSIAPALTYGSVSRTISERGPGIFNWDMSLFKNFTLYERFRAQFRFEALNAFNTPMFRSPNTSFGSGSFGQVLSQGNFPRFVDFALRLSF